MGRLPQLGGSWPTTLGWALAFCAIPIVIVVDTTYKALRRRGSRGIVYVPRLAAWMTGAYPRELHPGGSPEAIRE